MSKRNRLVILIISILYLLTGCNTGAKFNTYQKRAEEKVRALVYHSSGADSKQAFGKNDTDLPTEVDSALLSPVKQPKKKKWHQFDIAVNSLPISQFFSSIANQNNINIIVSPKLKTAITLTLNQVTLPEVIAAVQSTYDIKVKSTSYGYKIMPVGLETRTYVVDWLAMTRSGTSHMKIDDLASEEDNNNSNNTTNSTNTNNSSNNQNQNTNQLTSAEVVTTFGGTDYWKELESSLYNLIGGNTDGRRITINRTNGLVVVRAKPKAQTLIASYLQSIHAINTKQIIIDARVIEIIHNNKENIGLGKLTLPHLSWQSSGETSALNLKYTKGTDSSFQAIFNMLSHYGKISVLSSPRVATLNNQKALIKVGKDEYYSTGLSNTLIPSTTSTASNSNLNLRPFFSGIALDVTPQVDANNEVLLHIHPIISDISRQPFDVPSGDGSITLQLPSNRIRETDTIVSAHSGQIIVIAGLSMESNFLSRNSIPGWKNGPNSYRKDVHERRELIILLQPTIVDKSTWSNRLNRSASALRHLDQ